MLTELRALIARTGLAVRLVIGLIVLIIVTTLSAGVPALILTTIQLEQQARQQVDATRRSTQSLFLAAQSNLTDLTLLLAERPTLRQILLSEDRSVLEPYLAAFQFQSDLDLIQMCDGPTLTVSLGDASSLCPAEPGSGFEILDDRPVLLAVERVAEDNEGGSLGTVITGIRLDGEFLRQLSANTGAQQSILRSDGALLATTLAPGLVRVALQPGVEGGIIGELQAGELSYYTSELPLADRRGRETLVAEVELPVDRLRQTERAAQAILFASTGLVALLGVVVGVWYVRRLVAPLNVLTRAAERISGGDLTAPIPKQPGPPELRTLSASLENSQAAMIAALDERSQARDWLNTLIQSVVEGVITFDTSGRVTFMSQGAESLTGWSSEAAVGQRIDDILPLADASEESFLDLVPPPGEKREIEVRNRQGKTIILATTGARMVPPNSDRIQVALVLRDVTEEQAVRNLRSFFLANITHEFRTPLSTLSASLELLMDQADSLSPAEIRELLQPTSLSLRSLQTLIDNLLESSRIEAGSFVLRRREADLNEIVADALIIVRPLLERRRQQVTVTEPAQLPTLTADAARLTQALVNLLTNASKYSPIGEPIDLIITQTDNQLRISVADRGPGISTEDRLNLFRRFVRLHPSGDEQYGVGLGLYLVKRIAEAHGGRVGVDDRPGGGAIFWLELPLAPGDEAPSPENVIESAALP